MSSHFIHPLVKNIAFFGDAAVSEHSEPYRMAYHAAELLAREGYVVVNGGGPGVMAAATKGAEEAGGETLSVTFYPKHATGFEGRYVGNVTDTEIKTSNYVERMFKLMEHADLYLMFRGGTGTISEFGTAWVLAKLYYGHHKPFILVGSFWRPVIKAIEENLLIDNKEKAVFEIVDTVDDILPAMKRLEKDLVGIDHSHCKVCSEGAFMS